MKKKFNYQSIIGRGTRIHPNTSSLSTDSDFVVELNPNIGKIELYWSWTTNPQKIRLALEELELDYQLHMVNLKTGEQRHPEYMAQINPMGTVPALKIDGKIFWESTAALLYLAQTYTLLHFLHPHYDKFLNLLFQEASSVQRLAGTLFIEKKIHPLMGKPSNQESIQDAQRKLLPILNIWQNQLAEQEYLFDEFSIMECALAPWLPWIDLSDHPALLAWKKRIQDRPSWKACGFRDC